VAARRSACRRSPPASPFPIASPSPPRCSTAPARGRSPSRSTAWSSRTSWRGATSGSSACCSTRPRRRWRCGPRRTSSSGWPASAR
jgi:hypothetical protein